MVRSPSVPHGLCEMDSTYRYATHDQEYLSAPNSDMCVQLMDDHAECTVTNSTFLSLCYRSSVRDVVMVSMCTANLKNLERFGYEFRDVMVRV